MEDARQRAQRDLPRLRQSVKELLALAHEITENVAYSEKDHLAFMALCFLSKQIDHTQSVLALIPSRDVILIARSMIEGLCQLLWAAQEPDRLPLQCVPLPGSMTGESCRPKMLPARQSIRSSEQPSKT